MNPYDCHAASRLCANICFVYRDAFLYGGFMKALIAFFLITQPFLTIHIEAIPTVIRLALLRIGA